MIRHSIIVRGERIFMDYIPCGVSVNNNSDQICLIYEWTTNSLMLHWTFEHQQVINLNPKNLGDILKLYYEDFILSCDIEDPSWTSEEVKLASESRDRLLDASKKAEFGAGTVHEAIFYDYVKEKLLASDVIHNSYELPRDGFKIDVTPLWDKNPRRSIRLVRNEPKENW